MKTQSLDDIFGNFNPTKTEDASESLRDRRPLTIWLPASAKDRYDHLQKLSGRRFGKKVRELIQAAIDRTEAKAS